MWRLMKRFLPSTPSGRSTARGRRSFKPDLEQLGERQLLSGSGVISSITDAGGNTSVFAIGRDNRIYWAVNGSSWGYSSPDTLFASTPRFREVSAGLDDQGHAHCYAINIADSSLWLYDPYYGWCEGLGGNCAHISATTHNECYVIGGDHSVWLYQGDSYNSTPLMYPSGGAVQISAGVDRWGQDKVYIVSTSGYVLEDNHDGSWKWLADAQGRYLRAGQVSAGIGANTTDVDLYYISAADQSLHWFDGSRDTPLGGYCLQLSASLDRYGQRECYVIATDHSLWTRNSSSWYADGGQCMQISATQNDMVFAVSPGSHDTMLYDPNSDWLNASWTGYGLSYWHWSGGGVTGNPDYNYV
jgi:hypothetical protein